MIEFTAARSPRVVSQEIEEYAKGQGHVCALVVPWESERLTLSMAVTSVKGVGWAIEHTNLGTIRLTDLGNDTTRVTIAPSQPAHPDTRSPDTARGPDAHSLATLFDRFTREIQQTFQVAP